MTKPVCWLFVFACMCTSVFQAKLKAHFIVSSLAFVFMLYNFFVFCSFLYTFSISLYCVRYGVSMHTFMFSKFCVDVFVKVCTHYCAHNLNMMVAICFGNGQLRNTIMHLICLAKTKPNSTLSTFNCPSKMFSAFFFV